MPFSNNYIEDCDCGHCRSERERERAAQAPAEPPPPLLQCEGCVRSSDRWPHLEFRLREGMDNMLLCDYCARSYSYCEAGDHYGAYVARHEIVGEAEALLMCEGCFENQGYRYCDYCERQFIEDWPFPDDYMCQSCWENSGTDYDDDGDYRYVFNYSYRPTLNFNRVEGDKDDFYMGVELETDEVNVYEVSREVDASQPQLFCKSDASLYSGVEIVSHPGTLAAWQAGKVIDWDQWGNVASMCLDMSEQDRAGIHIHVSRTAFERNGRWSPSHMWKFMQLHYRNELAFTSLAGRTSTGYAEWSPVTDREKILNDVKNDGAYAERHRPININNRDTIELRYFQADERQEVLLQHVELIHAAVEYTRATTAKDVKEGALDFARFRSWVSAKPEVYPHLRKAMNRRVAEGIITANRSRTNEHDMQLKGRKEAGRLEHERRIQWFRELGLSAPRANEVFTFVAYPEPYGMDDIRDLFRRPNDYIRYVASVTTTVDSFVEVIATQLTHRYARCLVNGAGGFETSMNTVKWRIARAYAAAQFCIVARENDNTALDDPTAEAIINRVVGIR